MCYGQIGKACNSVIKNVIKNVITGRLVRHGVGNGREGSQASRRTAGRCQGWRALTWGAGSSDTCDGPTADCDGHVRRADGDDATVAAGTWPDGVVVKPARVSAPRAAS
jgi:hypothetical protein